MHTHRRPFGLQDAAELLKSLARIPGDDDSVHRRISENFLKVGNSGRHLVAARCRYRPRCRQPVRMISENHEVHRYNHSVHDELGPELFYECRLAIQTRSDDSHRS
jgi:hypothetical protein